MQPFLQRNKTKIQIELALWTKVVVGKKNVQQNILLDSYFLKVDSAKFECANDDSEKGIRQKRIVRIKQNFSEGIYVPFGTSLLHLAFHNLLFD